VLPRAEAPAQIVVGRGRACELDRTRVRSGCSNAIADVAQRSGARERQLGAKRAIGLAAPPAPSRRSIT